MSMKRIIFLLPLKLLRVSGRGLTSFYLCEFRDLSEEDYECFMESLDNMDGHAKEEDDKEECDKEIRVGVKDWWTKSKYAYLNQPAIESKNPPNRRSSSFVPNRFSFKASSPLYSTSLGAF